MISIPATCENRVVYVCKKFPIIVALMPRKVNIMLNPKKKQSVIPFILCFEDLNM